MYPKIIDGKRQGVRQALIEIEYVCKLWARIPDNRKNNAARSWLEMI